MEPGTPNRHFSTWIFIACGVWLIGLGLYFLVLRPALLPEDLRYIGPALPETTLPGLERWLRRVFTVMGGFMTSTGLLIIFLAPTAVSTRRPGAGWVFTIAGLFTVVLMSVMNFMIDSDFKWLLLAPALLWLGGIACYVLHR